MFEFDKKKHTGGKPAKLNLLADGVSHFLLHYLDIKSEAGGVFHFIGTGILLEKIPERTR